MKKVILFITILFIVSLGFACGRNNGARDGYYWGHGFGMGYGAGCYEDRNYMMNDLNLTNDQADKIADIDAKYRKLYYENRGDFDKIDSLRREHQAAIDKVLTDDQKSRYDSTYNNKWGGWGRGYGRRHMGDYYGHGYGMGYGAGCYQNRGYMMNDLGLTEDQANKIGDIDEKYRNLYDKNRDHYDKIDELRREHRNAINDVLNSEQRDKYSGVYDNRWRGWGGHMGPGRGMMGY